MGWEGLAWARGQARVGAAVTSDSRPRLSFVLSTVVRFSCSVKMTRKTQGQLGGPWACLPTRAHYRRAWGPSLETQLCSCRLPRRLTRTAVVCAGEEAQGVGSRAPGRTPSTGVPAVCPGQKDVVLPRPVLPGALLGAHLGWDSCEPQSSCAQCEPGEAS